MLREGPTVHAEISVMQERAIIPAMTAVTHGIFQPLNITEKTCAGSARAMLPSATSASVTRPA